MFLGHVNQLLVGSPLPASISYAWGAGSSLGVLLVGQILSGIILVSHYSPTEADAFVSVEVIMREVHYGWAFRYAHANGASLFLLLVYVHVGRGLYFRSFSAPRSLLWTVGVSILLILIMTAFLGYTLVWGQMSFWGATVITNLVSAVPWLGPHVVEWIWGGFAVDHATLNRFFAAHFVLPFGIVGLVLAHLLALHHTGSTNPLGTGSPLDKVPFHPYFTLKDVVGFTTVLLAFTLVVGYAPDFLGHPDNYAGADPLVTPSHIVPEWYFLPFYAILRAVPDKLLGVLCMAGSLAVLFILPVCSRRPGLRRSAIFFPLRKAMFWIFAGNFVLLGWLGTQAIEPAALLAGQAASLVYAAYFCLTILL